MGDFLFYALVLAAIALVWIRYSNNSGAQLNALKGKTKNVTWIKVVEIALLMCAGLMGSFFAYELLSPISAILAILAAVLVVFFNMAEGLILRSTVNSFRHNNILVGGIGVATVLMLMLYSLTAGSSVIETFLNKHDDIAKAYQYEELASKQKIEGAKAGILKAQMEAKEKDPYSYLTNPNVAQAQKEAALVASNEYSRMAQLMKDKAPTLQIAFGFDHESIAFLMALVLELSIVGVVIYQVLYIQNDALLASVKYENKILGWNVNANHTANLSLEHSPAPEIVALPYNMNNLAFAGAIPSVQPSVNSVPIHRAQTAPQPSAHGTHGYSTTHGTHGTASLNDSNLAHPDKQDELFDLWVSKLKKGDLSPSTRDTREFITNHKLATGIKLIAGLADSWLERAENIGVLALNPNHKNGTAKYILASEKPSLVKLDKE